MLASVSDSIQQDLKTTKGTENLMNSFLGLQCVQDRLGVTMMITSIWTSHTYAQSAVALIPLVKRRILCVWDRLKVVKPKVGKGIKISTN